MPMEQRRAYADVLVDGLLDLEGDLAGAWRLLLAAHELADHLVDGGRVRDGAGKLDRFGDAMGVLGVDGVVAGDEDDVGADSLASPTWVPVLMPRALAS